MTPKRAKTSEGIISQVSTRLMYRKNVKAGDILDMLDIYLYGFGYSFEEKYNDMLIIAKKIGAEVSC